MPDSNRPNPRRNVLGWLLGGSVAVVVAPALYVVARYLRPVRGAPASTVVGDPGAIPAADGRIVKVGMKDAIVMPGPDESFQALSLRCTHAGCNVRWNASDEQFHCPCHGGVFDRHGAVVDGPPRRPLERLRVEVESGRVVVFDEEA